MSGKTSRRKTTARAALLGLLAAVALWAWTTRDQTRLLEFESMVLSAATRADWQEVCFVPGYDSSGPNSVPARFGTCWNGRRTPEGSTFMMLSGENSMCEVFHIKADFLIQHGAETRCFPREDVFDLELRIEHGILKLHTITQDNRPTLLSPKAED